MTSRTIFFLFALAAAASFALMALYCAGVRPSGTYPIFMVVRPRVRALVGIKADALAAISARMIPENFIVFETVCGIGWAMVVRQRGA